MFGVVDAVLHPRPGCAQAARLLWLNPRMSYWSAAGGVTQQDLRRLIREQTRSFDAVVGVDRDQLPIQVGDEEPTLSVERVPPEWFDVLGVRMERGRAFTAGDGDGVVVISHALWTRATAERRDSGALHLVIGDRSYAVIGVLAPEARQWSAVIPISPARQLSTLGTLLRLRPGVTVERARADLAALAAVLTARYASPQAPWALNVDPFTARREQVADIHVAMVGAALIVLLIACANLAHLMLARGLSRRRELAVRMALGAGRRAVVRLMLTEGLVIALGGVVLGVVFAFWGAAVLRSLVPSEFTWVGIVVTQISWRVLALGGVAAAGSAVLFGLLPAVRVALTVELTTPLKADAGTTTGAARARYSPLVIAEVALALALMMGGALLLRMLQHVRHASLGFDAETLAQASVYAGYSNPYLGRPDSRTKMDWQEALASARRAPGVLDAALEFGARPSGMAVTAELSGDSTRMIVMSEYSVVSPEYLRVHGLPVLRGRDFEPGDAAGAGVAILSAAAEARLYPRRDAVGRMVKLGGPKSDAPWVRIVGVARTPLSPLQLARPGSLEAPSVWVAGPTAGWTYGTVLVRLRNRDPGALIGLRHALATEPGVRRATVQRYTWIRDQEEASLAFLSQLFVAMGAVGLGLAALGLYGVLAYAVTLRMREFAVRLALGAEPRVLSRMVLRDGLVMLLAGTAIGGFAALAAASLLDQFLVGVYPTDALSLAASEAVLLAVGLAATLAPARRALRANPVDILRAV